MKNIYSITMVLLLLIASPYSVESRERVEGSDKAKSGNELRERKTGTAEWILEISADTDDTSGRIILGVDLSATKGYEHGYDSFVGNVQANEFKNGLPVAIYFSRETWGHPHPYAWVDIVGGLPHEWTFIAATKNTGTYVRLSWNASALPEGFMLELLDNTTGNVIDMRAQSSFNYTSIAKIRGFTVKVVDLGSSDGTNELRTR